MVFTEADQELLTLIEQVLGQGAYESFGDLCKQALRRLLDQNLGETSLAETPPAPIPEPIPESSYLLTLYLEMQRQLTAMQERLVRLEVQGVEGIERRCDRLTGDMAALEQRLSDLEEQGVDSTPATDAEPPPPPLDPLLSHLGSLLEEF